MARSAGVDRWSADGRPDFEATAWFAVFGTAKLSRQMTPKLNATLKRVSRCPMCRRA